MKWLRDFLRRMIRRKSRVYLRPTIAGMWWLGTLFILFLIGWGYSNNLCLGIAMLLTSITMVFLMEAHFNLEGIKPKQLTVEDQFALKGANFRLVWQSRKKNIRRQIKVFMDTEFSTESWATSDWNGLEGEALGVTSLPVRGHHQVKHIKLTSTYPLGLFQAWCYYPLKAEAWTYPPLIEGKGIWEGESADAENARMRNRGDGEEPGEFRRYAIGDPPGRVAWKVVARGLPPHTKTFESPQTERRLYRWPWGAGGENELSILSFAIQASCDAGESWSLMTTQGNIDWGEDSIHRRDGLRLLSKVQL